MSKPAGTTAVSGTTIESAKYNSTIDDLVADANLARPIVAGGTGATSAAGALTALGLTATAAEINVLDGVTSTTAELNILDGVTATTAEINFVDGVTSNIQTQLNAQPKLLASKTASASAQLDFTETNNSLYRGYIFKLRNVKGATDSENIYLQFSTNGGSAYDAGVSDYTSAQLGFTSAGSQSNNSSPAAESIRIGIQGGNDTAEFGYTGQIEAFHCSDAAVYTRVLGSVSFDDTVGVLRVMTLTGRRNAAQDTDAFRFKMSTGNIASGEIEMWGVP